MDNMTFNFVFIPILKLLCEMVDLVEPSKSILFTIAYWQNHWAKKAVVVVGDGPIEWASQFSH